MQYINEENLGSEATEAHARKLVSILQHINVNVEYGNSANNDMLTETEQADFDSLFSYYLAEI